MKQVSKFPNSFFITFSPEHGSNMFSRNVAICLEIDTLLQSKTPNIVNSSWVWRYMWALNAVNKKSSSPGFVFYRFFRIRASNSKRSAYATVRVVSSREVLSCISGPTYWQRFTNQLDTRNNLPRRMIEILVSSDVLSQNIFYDVRFCACVPILAFLMQWVILYKTLSRGTAMNYAFQTTGAYVASWDDGVSFYVKFGSAVWFVLSDFWSAIFHMQFVL
jgi:hypothetical protein